MKRINHYLLQMKDNFSKRADIYARHRPAYPPELFDFILGYVVKKETAWDCGTGNGQAAKELCRYFKKVLATDISEKQIANAHKAENIFYSVQRAEKTDFADNSVDLITVATAFHWFDFENFFAEVKRVGTANSLLAVWAYSLLRISSDVDKLVDQYYSQTLKGYWDEERKYVDENYTTIPFPFEEIKAPLFQIEVNWSVEDLEGYLDTWSSLQKFIAENNYNPVEGLVKKIRPVWGPEEKRKIIFPVFLRLGKIH